MVYSPTTHFPKKLVVIDKVVFAFYSSNNSLWPHPFVEPPGAQVITCHFLLGPLNPHYIGNVNNPLEDADISFESFLTVQDVDCGGILKQKKYYLWNLISSPMSQATETANYSAFIELLPCDKTNRYVIIWNLSRIVKCWISCIYVRSAGLSSI